MGINQKRDGYWRKRWADKRTPQVVEFEDITELKDTQIAYLAGLIDGEGSFGIMLAGKHRAHVPVLTLCMAHLETVTWVKDLVGVAVAHKRRGGKTRREQWALRISGRKSIELCRRMIPFMITRKEQAEIFVEYDALGWHYGGATVLDLEQRALLREGREKLRQKLMRLNRPLKYVTPAPFLDEESHH